MLKLSLFIFASVIFALSHAQTFYTYKTVGDLNIQAAVYVPNITTPTPYPVVFVIHGGGYVIYSCTYGDLSTQELDEMLARGWVVVSIDYRLGPDAVLQDMIEDVQDAYNWVRTELVKTVNLNPNAIAVWGDSAGAGLTVISGYKLSPRPQAIIAFYTFLTNFTDPLVYDPSTPVSQDLIDAANALRQPLTEYIPPLDNDSRWGLLILAGSENKAGWLLTTSDPNADPNGIISELRDLSVVYNIDADYPPTYLIHGLNDTEVPYNQSTQMSAVLENAGVPYELSLVPGVGHAFDLVGVDQATWNEYLVPVFDFTQRWLSESSVEKIQQ